MALQEVCCAYIVLSTPIIRGHYAGYDCIDDITVEITATLILLGIVAFAVVAMCAPLWASNSFLVRLVRSSHLIQKLWCSCHTAAARLLRGYWTRRWKGFVYVSARYDQESVFLADGGHYE